VTLCTIRRVFEIVVILFLLHCAIYQRPDTSRQQRLFVRRAMFFAHSAIIT